MATIVNHYVGLVAGTVYPNELTHPTFEEALAALPADFTTSNGGEAHRLLLLNQEFPKSASFGTLTNKTSAECYLEITTAPGASYRDHAGKATNALRYNKDNGAAIKYTGAGTGLVIQTGYVRISNLQFAGADGTTAVGALVSATGTGTVGLDINGCIFEAVASGTNGVVNINGGSAGSTIRNSVVVQKRANTGSRIATLANGSKAYNVTFVSLGARVTTGVVTQYTATTFRNCYFGGADIPQGGSTNAAVVQTCAADVSGLGAGWLYVPMDTAAFQNVTLAWPTVHDFRLAANSQLIGAGTADATNAGTDIYGNAREGVYDIGAWEYLAPASPPVFTDDPDSLTAQVGNNAAFSVSVTGNPQPSLQWQVSTDGGQNWNNVVGQTGLTYTINGVTSADQGKQVRCSATNSAGGPVYSAAATLTVQIVAPAITQQPNQQTVPWGGNASFAVQASGSQPLSYQWQVDAGSGFVNIAGATTATLTINGVVTADNGKQYRCVVNNESGTPATSSAAPLIVTAIAPSITQQPASAPSVVAGDRVTLSVVSPDAASYQWQYRPSGGAWTNIAGATASSYQTDPTTVSGGAANNGDSYQCLLTHVSGGTATTATSTLTVNAGAVAPSVTQQPANAERTAGQTASFAAAFAGTGTIAYQWQRLAPGGVWTNIPGATGATYTTDPVTISGGTANDGDQYRCIGSNGTPPDATTDAATLTVGAALATATVTLRPLMNWVDQQPLVGLTVPTIILVKLADGLPKATAVNKVTDTDGRITISDAALEAGSDYLAFGFDATGDNATWQKVRAQ